MSEDDNSSNIRIDRLFKGDGSTSNTSEGNGSPVIMSGCVRKRNKIFFFKKRNMFVLENGMIIIKKCNGQTEETLQLNTATEITELKGARLKIKH